MNAVITHDLLGDPVRALRAKEHQNQLMPAENKFHRGAPDGFHYWIRPDDLYERYDAEFHFDFDPCPYPRPDGFDGLTCEWGKSNWVNPPFGSTLEFPPSEKHCDHEPKTRKSKTCKHCGLVGVKKGPTAWIRKAIAEWRKGKTVVLIFPMDKWVPLIVCAIVGENADIRNERDVKFTAIENGAAHKGTGRHIVAFILRGELGRARAAATTQSPTPHHTKGE